MTYRIIDTITLLIIILAIFFFSFYSQELVNFPKHLWYLNRILIDTARGYEYEFITANFAHFDMHHALENIGALILIWYLFFSSEIDTSLHKITLLVIPMLGTTFGVYLFDLNTSIYGGMSGALHGMAAGAALLRLVKNREFKALLVLIALGIKLLIDFKFPELTFNNLTRHIYGEAMNLEFTSNTQAYAVCPMSHLAGTVSGCLIAGLLFIAKAIRHENRTF